MTGLQDILDSETYKELKSRLVDAIKRKEDSEEVKERTKDKRKEIMKYLQDLYSDELCKKYIALKGDLPIYKISFTQKIVFRPDGIYLRVGIEDVPFDEGYGSREVNCGMGGTSTREYEIEEIIGNTKRFKKEVTENICRKLKKLK
ncbi:hypothetical protein ACFLZJ_02030 [Nanoarchaeota archaeon]